MAGTPSRTDVVKGVPATVADDGCVISRARCAKRSVSGDGSGDGGSKVVDYVVLVVVGCWREDLWSDLKGGWLRSPSSDGRATTLAGIGEPGLVIGRLQQQELSGVQQGEGLPPVTATTRSAVIPLQAGRGRRITAPA